jgi:hypothetical protein
LVFGLSCLSGIVALINIFFPFQFKNGKFEAVSPDKLGYTIPVSMSIGMVPDTVISYTNGTSSFGKRTYPKWYDSDPFIGDYQDSLVRVAEADSSYKKKVVVNKWVASPGVGRWNNKVRSIGGKDGFEILEKEIALSELTPMVPDISTTVEIKARGKTKWQNFMLSLYGWIQLFLYIFISFHILRVLQVCRREIQFLNNLYRRLELVGKVLMYSQVLYFLFAFVYGKYFGSIRLVSVASDDGFLESKGAHFNPTSAASLGPFLIGVGLFILSKFFQYGQNIEINLRELEQVQTAKDAHHAQLQQNLLELENNFLRAQINPHFLYNTLNVFYAKALPTNKDLANGLLTLADIMRYSLETTQGGHLVPLQMEVEHLKRVIGLHQLRFGERLRIQFTAEGPFGEIKVAPLIFITLLENALKHGEVDTSDEPIVLWLAVDAHRIYFTIRNKKSEGLKAQSHGLGLDNIKKRLQAVYGRRHDFDIEEKEGYYHVAMAVEHTGVVDSLPDDS